MVKKYWAVLPWCLLVLLGVWRLTHRDSTAVDKSESSAPVNTETLGFHGNFITLTRDDWTGQRNSQYHWGFVKAQQEADRALHGRESQSMAAERSAKSQADKAEAAAWSHAFALAIEDLRKIDEHAK